MYEGTEMLSDGYMAIIFAVPKDPQIPLSFRSTALALAQSLSLSPTCCRSRRLIRLVMYFCLGMIGVCVCVIFYYFSEQHT